MIVGNTMALTEGLGRYDPLAYLVHRRPDGEDDNYIRERYQEHVLALLRLVQPVQEGEPPALYEPVVIEWGEIDGDVRAVLAEDGAPEGITGPEMLRAELRNV